MNPPNQPTPRADAIDTYIRARNDYTKTDHQVWIEHARTLERELGQARDAERLVRMQLADARYELAAFRREGLWAKGWSDRNKIAGKDSKRMDWLEKHGRDDGKAKTPIWYEIGEECDAGGKTFRGEIDAAMSTWAADMTITVSHLKSFLPPNVSR